MAARRQRKPTEPPLPARIAPKASRTRRWWFRGVAFLAVPFIILLIGELALRLAGFGQPTAFLLSTGADPVLIPNDRFGWPFFGRELARQPQPFSISRTKPPGTIRVFVFGESAAYGDPHPEFGLARMLQTLLSVRYPDTRFEVVNTAMTAINSHVIQAQARDCTQANADLWVVYMGNNEAVGPFGPATVFGPQTPPRWLIRAGLAVKRTRTGQLLDDLRRRWQPAAPAVWGGMTMFLDNQIRRDDPRLERAYRHFAHNLDQIVAMGLRSGAGVVLSTVAVNLQDCAPFASMHRPDLPADSRKDWQRWYLQGAAAQDANQPAEAIEAFERASGIDDTMAALHFRWATCLLQTGQTNEAQRHLRLARDLDSLRFRCDSRLNDIIRSAGASTEGVRLADADQVFSEQPQPGALFYEHVHLTFEGQYLLARTIADQLVALLPQEIARAAPERPWPDSGECARRLAWTAWNRQVAVAEIFARVSEPPYTHQLNHADSLARIRAELVRLEPATRQQALLRALAATEDAIASAPDDPLLLSQLAWLSQRTHQPVKALEAARKAAALLPHSTEAAYRLGLIGSTIGVYPEALIAFRTALELDPENIWAWHGLAQTLDRSNDLEQAARAYRTALKIKPRFGPAHLGLGQLLEKQGRLDEAAEHFRLALRFRVIRATELTALAQFCQLKGWWSEAVTNYLDAIRLNPLDPMLHLEAGRCLAAIDRGEEAGRHYLQASRLDPGSAEAQFLLGLQLGRQDQPADAAVHFANAIRLNPAMEQARLNLGIALLALERRTEALGQFEEVLRRNPTNQIALQYSQALRSPPP